MNAKKMIAAAVAAFAATGSAFAQGSTEWVDLNDFVSTKTRAEVKAELAQAHGNGELVRSEFVEFPQTASSMTRAQVRAELARAKAEGSMQNTEWVEHPHIASSKTREEVRNEVLQAAKAARANHGS